MCQDDRMYLLRDQYHCYCMGGKSRALTHDPLLENAQSKRNVESAVKIHENRNTES